MVFASVSSQEYEEKTAPRSFEPRSSPTALSLYIQEAGKYPLLRHEDEIRLAKNMELRREEVRAFPFRYILHVAYPFIYSLEQRVRGGNSLDFSQLLNLEQVEEKRGAGKTYRQARNRFLRQTAQLHRFQQKLPRLRKPRGRDYPSAYLPTIERGMDIATALPLREETWFTLYQEIQESEQVEAKVKDNLTSRIEAYTTARNKIMQSNLRLVISHAKKFQGKGLPLEDLINEGNLGLMRAVDLFDYKRGYRFSTYALWWIRHSLVRALSDKGRLIRYPVHLIGRLYQLGKIERSLEGKYSRPPTEKEVASQMGLSTSAVQKLRLLLGERTVSIDAPVSDEDGRQRISFLEDHQAVPETTQVAAQELHTAIERALEPLKEIEADILRSRFGLYGNGEKKLRELGEKYNLSRERIRQLQNQALAKLRRWPALQGWHGYEISGNE